MVSLAAVAVGGGLGAASRYGVDRLIEQHTEGDFPWATFAINVTGCLLAGLLISILLDRLRVPSWVGLGATTGFVGGYTTFSTFGVETYDLLDLGHTLLAVVYVASSAVVGVAAVALGLWVGRSV
jgi:fluoride exporter